MTWNPTSGTKPCGCGPLQPCEPHRDTGDLQDWKGRARAAEETLAAERRAFHGTLIRFAAEAVRGKHAYGLDEEPAFEALRRIGVDLKKAADEMAAADLRDDAGADQALTARMAAMEETIRASERARIRRGVLAREMVLQHPVDGDRVAVLTLDLEQVIGAEDGSDG